MADLISLPLERRKQIARDVCMDIDASERAKGTLPKRWKRNEDLYHVVPGVSGVSVGEMEPYTIPLLRPKADRIIGNTVSAFTSLYPYVQAIEEGGDGANEETLEASLMCMASKAGFDSRLKEAIRMAVLTDIGVLRVRPTQDERGNMRLSIECIHPRHHCAYPHYVKDTDLLKTTGHRFYLPAYEIAKRVKDKRYYKIDVEKITGDEHKEHEDANPRDDLTGEHTGEDAMDGPVELWEVVTLLDTGQGKRWHLAVVAKTSEELLSLQDYPYTKPWYVPVRLLGHQEGYWPVDCVAQPVQGLGMLYSDMFTLAAQGSMVMAFPPVALIGSSLMDAKRKYGPAEIWELPEGAQLQQVEARMDLGAMPALMQKVEELFDACTGVSRIGTTQNLPSNTTATAAAALTSAEQSAKDQYVDAVSPAVQSVWEMAFEYLYVHPEEFAASYGPALTVAPEALEKKYRFEVTGKSAASNPQTLLQKLQLAFQLASDPASPFDPVKVLERIFKALDLPFSTEGLKKDAISQLMQALTQLEAQGIPAVQIATQAVQQTMQEMALAAQINEALQQTDPAGNPGGNASPVPEPQVGGGPVGFPA